MKNFTPISFSAAEKSVIVQNKQTNKHTVNLISPILSYGEITMRFVQCRTVEDVIYSAFLETKRCRLLIAQVRIECYHLVNTYEVIRQMAELYA